MSHKNYYRPQTKLQKGNVFRSMCQEFCPQGYPSQGGGMRGQGACVVGMWWGCVCGRGHVWQGVHGRGAWQGVCMVGGVHSMTGGHAWLGGCAWQGGMHGGGGGGLAWQEIRPLQRTVRILLEMILVYKFDWIILLLVSNIYICKFIPIWFVESLQ